MFRKWLLCGLLSIPAAFAYDITESYGTHDIYLVDVNQDGKASLKTLLEDDDTAIVLMHQPDFIDVVKANAYAKPTFVFMTKNNALFLGDLNRDKMLNSQDSIYPNLGLFSYDKKTGKVLLTPLSELKLTISLADIDKGQMLLIDEKNNLYPIKLT